MRNPTVFVLGAFAVLLLAISIAPAAQSGYGEDRALIEDLQARYLFALDFKDAEAYAATFTEDGILDYGPKEVVKGRVAIRDLIAGMGKRDQEQAAKDKAAGLRPSAGRHNISNIVLKITGNKAVGRSYWFHYGNNNPQRTGSLDSYGHYEDEMVKVNGKWLFSKRKIYNEQVADWAAKGGNPAW